MILITLAENSDNIGLRLWLRLQRILIGLANNSENVDRGFW